MKTPNIVVLEKCDENETFRLVFIRGERISTCNTRTSLRLDVAPLGHERLDSLVKTTFSHPRFVFGSW